MATINSISKAQLTELADRLGGIALERIRRFPAPGTATEDDLIEVNERKEGLCELVEGVLVEKAVGHYESCLTTMLIGYLDAFLRAASLGFLAGPDGMIRFAPGLVREPDISVMLWDDLPERRIPRDAVSAIIPTLAIEVLSRSNTKKEIARKIGEYFAAGSRLVWIVDPPTKTVRIHQSPENSVTIGEEDVLTGSDVLPGFMLSIREWFDRAG